ncbi:hypothetical protein VA7868_03869 [Vibrio aerogenes CECT 7868]|uniref:Uncharacterized protein n=1 Tax=Vibrio aerogenes CECT 7868 TaxID=1216006 RepID=A0A1M6BU43_9VIBR|nr:hypothetical protein [Vibrio aerogenes]SHI52266.1 hypothetical protein VA7868_03869 [Vibrio aerogenes CECT 7868]
MKKLISPLLLLPSLAFAHTNAVDFPIQAACSTADKSVTDFKLELTNLSDNATSVIVDLWNQSGNTLTSVNTLYEGDGYTNLTLGSAFSIPAHTTVRFYTSYAYNYAGFSGVNINLHNPCSVSPVMGKITHLDANSQIIANGYSGPREKIFNLNINNGQPF